MIRTLLTTTAVALLLSAPAMAQNAAPAAPAANAPAASAPANNTQVQVDPALQDMLAKGYQVADTDNLASRIIGAPVYSSTADDAERIGDINDIVLNQDGQIGAVVIGVGGFLGVGEKNVAVDFKALQFAVAADNTERWVLPTNKDQLSAAADFQWVDDEPTDTAANANANNNGMAPANNTAAAPAADTAAVNNNNAMAPANNNAAPAPATNTAANANNNNNAVTQGMQSAQDTSANANAKVNNPNALDMNGMTSLESGTLTAEELDDVDVIGSDNTEIAEVSDIVLTPDGKVDALLIDFGGFLGIGQKTVAVGMDNLQFMQDQNGKRFVKVNATREQLDAAPQYDKDTYAQNRDSQRLVVGNNG